MWVKMSLPERILVLPQGEPCVQAAEYRNWPYQSGCTEVAASREVLLGKLIFSPIVRVNSAFGTYATIIV